MSPAQASNQEGEGARLGERKQSARYLEFAHIGKRTVVADFEGGTISSDGGALLLRKLEARVGMVKEFADCFRDYRHPDLIEHSVEELVKQRIYGLALGYEDLNDHDRLRTDPLLAVVVGKADPTGQDRLREQDRGKPLAGKSTLNRMELTPAEAGPEARYKKIVMQEEKVEEWFLARFVHAHREPPRRVVLDFDATDDPVHGQQEGRFFQGHYGEYCYLPLYVFAEGFVLCAQLRPGNVDAAEGALEELQRIVGYLRQHWPEVEIVVRGDAGFAREPIMKWCEANRLDYVLGLAKNSRLEQRLARKLRQAQADYRRTGQAARRFKSFRYRTRRSWSRRRRVVGKAEYLEGGANPRFVVTSLPASAYDAATVYEREYCARGEMENRIKEQQLDLFADRTSTESLRANQLRLWFSAVAYTLLHWLRVFGLKGSQRAKAQCGTIRQLLLKIGAQVRISVRRVVVSLASSYPGFELFHHVFQQLDAVAMRC